MIYLDYSATTPVNREVLDSYNRVCFDYIGNTNSLHTLGIDSRELMDSASEQVANILECNINELIYTSGSTEANNLAIKGIAYEYRNRGMHIITTKLEHSSVSKTIEFLETKGYEVDYVDINKEGLINEEHLRKLIRKDTILVSTVLVNSELGVKQKVNDIGKIIKEENYNTFYHVDATQAVGKIKFSLDNIDLLCFSAHKFYGLKGIGVLYKKESVNLEPQIHGGKSQSEYRAGTPALPLIVSLAKALRLANDNLISKNKNISRMNKKIVDELKKYKNVEINSNDNSIPHIINLSLINIKPETMLHALSKYDIFISTKSACSTTNNPSQAVLAIGKGEDLASSSIRISLSHLTKSEEVDMFIKCFLIEYEALLIKKEGI